MISRHDQIVFPGDAPSEACHTDDEQGNLVSRMRLRFHAPEAKGTAYREREFDGVVDHDLLLGAPDVVEEVEHDLDGFVPDETVVALALEDQVDRDLRGMDSVLTSEKAGAVILR